MRRCGKPAKARKPKALQPILHDPRMKRATARAREKGIMTEWPCNEVVIQCERDFGENWNDALFVALASNSQAARTCPPYIGHACPPVPFSTFDGSQAAPA